jgi:hypothetical protein
VIVRVENAIRYTLPGTSSDCVHGNTFELQNRRGFWIYEIAFAGKEMIGKSKHAQPGGSKGFLNLSPMKNADPKEYLNERIIIRNTIVQNENLIM